MTDQTKPEEITETNVYIVREMSISDNPADEGKEIKRFRGENAWSKAAAYRDALYSEGGIQSYISSIKQG